MKRRTLTMPWRRSPVALSPPATEATGAVGREIESWSPFLHMIVIYNASAVKFTAPRVA
jgi:hypothetical protein